MRVLNSSEIQHIAGGDDAFIMFLYTFPPEQRDKALKGALLGHSTITGSLLFGGVAAGVVSLMTESAVVIVGGGMLGAVGGGVMTYSLVKNLLKLP